MGYQEIFKSLLLRHVEIEKLGISGKLNNVLFSTENNGFGIELSFSTEGRNRILKVPSPFEIEHHKKDKLLYLDYRLRSIFNQPRWSGVSEIIQEHQATIEQPVNKFFNTIIEISYR